MLILKAVPFATTSTTTTFIGKEPDVALTEGVIVDVNVVVVGFWG